MKQDWEQDWEQDWGEKWQNGGGRYALSENSTVSRVEFYFYPSSTASGPPSPQGEGKKKGSKRSHSSQGEGKKKGIKRSPLLEQRKVNVVLGHRKRVTYALFHLVPKKHYQCFS